MALAAIELVYLAKEISEQTSGYYINNIYSINQDSILLKLHHPQKPDLILAISSMGIWLTKIKIAQIEPNRLVRRLRDDLLRLKLDQVEQLGTERIIQLRCSGFNKEFILICEFFADGNIILCNKDLKILALLHSVTVRHRELKVGATYTPPPQRGINIFELSHKDFASAKSLQIPVVRWFGKTFGLPSKYSEHILRQAKIDFELPASSLSDENISDIIRITKSVLNDIISGIHNPVIVQTEQGPEAHPILLGQTPQYTSAPTFMEALDTAFSQIIMQKGKTTQSSSLEKKILQLQNTISEQENAITQLKESSQKIAQIAESFYLTKSASISDPQVMQKLQSQNVQVIKEKGITYLKIDDSKIQIKPDASLFSIASTLYDESKRKLAAIKSIESLKSKNQKELEKLKSQSHTAQNQVTFTQFKKKEWFERYRWFYTSDSLLAIGGRDSSSNSAIIRKQLEDVDLVFHAEIFGSPFFILKNPPEPVPFDSVNEVAQATVCFSRAWREAMYGSSAYWVKPSQVKKAAPSGQFLPKGSFILEGQKNFVRITTLKLAVGIFYKDDHYMLMCGPPEPVKKHCLCYGVIEPQGQDQAEVAKKLRTEFIKLNEEIAKQFSIDDFVRVLPAGKSHITDFGGKIAP